MKVISLRAENFKRLKAVQIDADPEVNVIAGRNAQGKTALLDSIVWALRGAKESPEEPIRKGADGCEVVLELDTLVVEKRQNEGQKPRLIVRNKDGFEAKSPQGMLDRLWGDRTIDPHEFARLKPAEQAEHLMAVLGLDFSKLDHNRKIVYDERTTTNHDLRRALAHRQSLPHHEDAPDEEVSVARLMTELKRREEHNRRNGHRREELEKRQAEGQSLKHDIEAVEARLKGMKERLEILNNVTSELRERVAELEDADVAGVREMIESAEAVNGQVRENKARLALSADIAALERLVKKQTTTILTIDAEKARLVAEADSPIPGLSFDANGVRLNGVPVSQLSSSEQWTLWVGMAMALHPELKIILVREGEKLDADNRRILAELAHEGDLQLWIEDCRAVEGEATLVIEDGTLMSKSTKPS